MAQSEDRSSTAASIAPSKTKVEGVADGQSPSASYSDPSALALAPYTAPSSFFSEFNLPFNTDDDATNGLWDFDNNGDAGSLPYVSGSQLGGQQSEGLGSSNATSSRTTINNGNSTGRSSTAQMPAHIAKNNPFLNKLRSMVDDPATNDLICWSDDGETFLVPNHVRFGDEVLPRFFKHNRFSSFVRQLNMYGFHKVPHLQQGALKSDLGQENELWEFKNDNFQRDRPELLLNMQRKKGVRAEDEPTKGKGKDQEQNGDGDAPLNDVTGALMKTGKSESETGLIQLASVWSAIQSIQAAQQGINDNLRHLHNTNNELFREAAEQRARTQKQEETINKMLRFLAGVFGAQDIGGEKRSGQGSGAGSAGGDSRRRRVVVRPSFGKNKSGRLMIGDSSMGDHDGIDDQIEELEIPVDDEELTAHIQELPSMSRSNSNSPISGTAAQSRFSSSANSPETKTQELPNISSEVTATPGGGRRISQQAGAQILGALSSGEGSAWLASLFGQQPPYTSSVAQRNATQPAQGERSIPTPGGGSFKLDAQTLATLQSVLGGMSNGENAPGAHNSYFGASTTPRTPAAGKGGSQATTTTPSRKTSTTPRVSNAVTPAADARLSRNQQNIQGTGQDAALVQGALNALVEGLKMDNGAATGVANENAKSTPAPPSSAPGTYNDNSFNEPSDVDMDKLLKEFLDAGAANSNDSSMAPFGSEDDIFGHNDTSGRTPEFAFSPKNSNGPAATPASTDERRSSSSTATNQNSAASTPRADSPSAVPSTTKKRKPAEFEGALGEDIERANARTRYSRKSSVK